MIDIALYIALFLILILFCYILKLFIKIFFLEQILEDYSYQIEQDAILLNERLIDDD